ncbi:hypothetical protein [Glaciecola sp. SC05]|uniref:hypothetical protein n=1 Tax=Glaciecola sp. SC05 TaxID=1987355 RepID=UPI0035279112
MIAILAIISARGTADTFGDMLFLVTICSWASVLLAFIYSLFANKSTIAQYVLASAFIAVAVVATYYLSLLALQVVSYGPLEASGLIFVTLPFLYIQFALYGALFGAFAYVLMLVLNKRL